MSKHVLAAVAALGAFGAGLGASVPATAQVEFAFFTPVPSSTGGIVNFKDDGAGNLESVSASTATVFAFDLTPLANFGNLQSTFDFTATQAGPATTSPSGEITAAFDGSFSYVYSGPTTTMGAITLTTGELLLSGTFTNATFSGLTGASGAGLEDDSISGMVTYASAIPTKDLPLEAKGQSFAMAFIDISPILAIQSSGNLRNFLAVGGGTFSSDVSGPGGGGTPEPATWALMLIGMGGIGAVVRYRSRRVPA